jgi:F-box interacting protein
MEPPINRLIDDLLKLVFWKVPLIDLIRAKAVCRRWKCLVDNKHFQVGFANSHTYCPLAFMKNDFGNHVWLGYDSTSSKWKRMPAFGDIVKKVDPLRTRGSWKGMLCLKSGNDYSSYTMFNPVIGESKPLPKSSDYWGASELQMVVEEETKNLKIVAIRGQGTEVYNFASNSWTKVASMPGSITNLTICKLKAKNGAAYSNGFLYCVGQSQEGFYILVSFNVATEKWSDDVIESPYPTSNAMEVECQVVECGGKIFAITETKVGLVEIWMFDCNTQRFSWVMEMPEGMCADVLNIEPGVHQELPKPGNIQCTANSQQIFIWQNHGQTIAAFHLLERKWEILPSIWTSDYTRSCPDMDTVEIDAAFFEPTFFELTVDVTGNS